MSRVVDVLWLCHRLSGPLFSGGDDEVLSCRVWLTSSGCVTDCQARCSLEVMMKRCHGRRRCHVPVSEDVFGRACTPSTRNYLHVVYACGQSANSPHSRQLICFILILPLQLHLMYVTDAGLTNEQVIDVSC